MGNTLQEKYRRYTKQRILFIIIVSILLFITAIASLLIGTADISLGDIFGVFQGKSGDIHQQLIVQVRLPRILGAILAGTALAISGAVIQSLLQNPLASPFTLGISGSSAFGAAFAIILLGAGSNYIGSNDNAFVQQPYLLSLSAFIWSLISVFIIVLLAKYKGATTEVIILSGIIINSLFGAGISAIQYFADDVQLASFVFWTFGDLGRANYQQIFIQSILIVPAIFYFIKQRWNYKAMQSGDDYAMSLGIKVKSVRLWGMIIAALLTSVVVSFYGIIAFVGLVVPHIVRRIIGGNELFLIVSSALFGGLFLLVSDTIARSIISPVVLPVGILTSFLGAPLFLFLLIKGIGKGYWK